MLVNVLSICSDDELMSDGDETLEEGKDSNLLPPLLYKTFIFIYKHNPVKVLTLIGLSPPYCHMAGWLRVLWVWTAILILKPLLML